MRYAPFGQFGGGFQGDGRTNADPNGTARVGASIQIDIGRHAVSAPRVTGKPSAGMSGLAELRQLMVGGTRSGAKGGSVSAQWHSPNSVTVNLIYWGNNGLVPGSPNI